MADQKISQLTELTSPLSGDTLPIVNNGETKRITVANLAVAGSSGSSGSSGTSGSDGTSGTSGLGVMASFYKGYRSTSQTSVGTGTEIIFNSTENSFGSDISLNTSTGEITLEANKTYRLRSNVGYVTFSGSGGGHINFQWYDKTNSTYIGRMNNVVATGSSTEQNHPNGGSVEAIITTTQQIVVVTKIVSSIKDALPALSITIGNSSVVTWFDVEVIGGNAPVTNGTSGTSGSNGSSGTSGSAGTSGSSGTSPVNVLLKTTGTWTLPTGASTQSFTVDANSSYSMWVNGNIPNGIINWNATATLSNTNVPAVGAQYGWYYATGNALVLTSMPNQFTGTNGSISNTPTDYAPNTSNVFNFGITNNSGASQIINYGYIKLS
jgi:hypothetical protein